ncbi:hypothetical protein BJY01DRAFT_215184 [Aspergillus pseudoustus]|uniref:Uncharacterized protein n=1 Tax=Aspergillus pseudoustus TaxID=1810923 RepID=A0ABR4JWF3_9EURO
MRHKRFVDTPGKAPLSARFPSAHERATSSSEHCPELTRITDALRQSDFPIFHSTHLYGPVKHTDIQNG